MKMKREGDEIENDEFDLSGRQDMISGHAFVNGIMLPPLVGINQGVSGVFLKNSKHRKLAVNDIVAIFAENDPYYSYHIGKVHDIHDNGSSASVFYWERIHESQSTDIPSPSLANWWDVDTEDAARQLTIESKVKKMEGWYWQEMYRIECENHFKDVQNGTMICWLKNGTKIPDDRKVKPIQRKEPEMIKKAKENYQNWYSHRRLKIAKGQQKTKKKKTKKIKTKSKTSTSRKSNSESDDEEEESHQEDSDQEEHNDTNEKEDDDDEMMKQIKTNILDFKLQVLQLNVNMLKYITSDLCSQQ
jgi:hypothetical protein